VALASDAAYEDAWLTWFLSNSIGVLMIAPLLISWAFAPRRPASRSASAELALLVALSAASSTALFVATEIPLVWAALVFPVVAALRHGGRGAAAAVFPWAAVAILATSAGHGVYVATTDSLVEAIRVAQASTAIGVVVCTALGAVAAQLRTAVGDLARSEERVRLLVDGVRDHAMFMLDADARIASWNAGAERLLGHGSEAVIGRPIDSLLLEFGPHLGTFDIASEQQHWVGRADGSTFLGRFAAYPVRDPEEGSTAYAVVVRDVTESHRAERQLAHMALHDSLTGLPNRTLLRDRLAVALSHAPREQGRVAVLFCDLDHFKVINDSLGHEAGDEVLKQVAGRFEEVVRPGDTVGRFGGDEFVFCCEDVAGADDARRIAERIAAELVRPFAVGEEAFVRASIGIALADASSTAEDLLRDADAAMYRAKHGGGGYALVDETDRARALGRLRGEAEIRRALDRDELRLHFQPIVELASGRIVAAEALLRWQHPSRGLIGPGEFIGLAEETGAIFEIGLWALEQGCRAGHRMRQAPGAPDLRVNVNVSGRQLADDGFVEAVGTILGRTATNPRGISLELTETTLIEDVLANQDALAGLKRLGVHIAMDDFGTGYSSLGYLRRLPIDQIKLDRSFVSELDDRSSGAPILRAAVAMAKALDIEVVAEGIERADQLALLGSLGYELGQGFHLGRPMPEDELVALLRGGRSGRGGGQRLRVVGRDDPA
jgi:diguanylate cyclase (GGDEF)-like protein/PAS domain S-box-containing protein